MLLRSYTEPQTLPEWTTDEGRERPTFTSNWKLSRDGSTFTRMDNIGQIYVLHVVTGLCSVI